MRRPKQSLEQRVCYAATNALDRHHHVSSIDILTGIGFLARPHVERWKRGEIADLETLLPGNIEKVYDALAIFHRWAHAKGLKATEGEYAQSTRSGMAALQFSRSGNPQVEQIYRTSFLSPGLSPSRQQQIQTRIEKPPLPVVYRSARRDACSECAATIEKDALCFKENELMLCLACAGFDELEFLPSGNVALTRRALKYCHRSAVVMRLRRGRYERIGSLFEPPALEQAEHECLEDAEERAHARAKAAVARQKQDETLVAEMILDIRRLFPDCPPAEVEAIARHTAVRGSGRVGRSEAGRNLEEHALTAAVIASVRHRHTPYDEMLARGVERESARRQIADAIDRILVQWRG